MDTDKPSSRRSQRNQTQKDSQPRGQQNGGGATTTTQVAEPIDSAVIDKSLHDKIDHITSLLTGALKRLDVVEDKVKNNVERLNEIEDGLHGLNENIEEFRSERKEYARNSKVVELEKKIEDLSNRSRRNNIVIWGIPEKAEKSDGKDCIQFVKDFLRKDMDISQEIEIERAHRSGNLNAKHSRPIHVKFLRYNDREMVLRKAPKVLKTVKRFGDKKIFLSDDVTESVRADRKKLLTLRNKLRDENKFATVLWSVPACLLTKNEDGSYKRVYIGNLHTV